MAASRHDVVVVGAGLAGLACARTLGRHLDDVVVLEAGDAVGGRVRTDHVDGFTLDRGFQVLNTGYPELRATVDLDALDLRAFDPAVGLFLDGRRHVVGDPLRRPATVAGALRLPVGGLAGKAALGAYAAGCVALPASRIRHRRDVSAADAWRHARIPDEVADRVLRAFFSGVLLEEEMSTSRRFTDLMVRMFARGASTVPARGMQALPEHLAAHLQVGTVRTRSRVRRITADGVETEEGTVAAHAVVLATAFWDGQGLLPGLSPAPPARGVTTVYHATRDLPGASAMLLLDGDDSPLANSIVLSQAAPEYAPPGTHLVASSLVHLPGGGTAVDPDGPEVRAALARLHGTDPAGWDLVATYDLPHALPGMPAPHPLHRRASVTGPGPGGRVYVAGDHRDTSSIQGALVSGRRVADALLDDAGLRRSSHTIGLRRSR